MKIDQVFIYLDASIPFAAELDYAKEEGRTETVLLDDGRAVKVPVGATCVREPNDPALVIEIKWDQDEEGRLLISEHKVRPYRAGDVLQDMELPHAPGSLQPRPSVGPAPVFVNAPGPVMVSQGGVRSVPVSFAGQAGHAG